MFSIPIDDFHEYPEMIHMLIVWNTKVALIVRNTKVAFQGEGALRLGQYSKEPRAK